MTGEKTTTHNMVLPKAWRTEYYETILLNLNFGKFVER